MIMCGGKGESDDNGPDIDNNKFQENLPIGMTVMDFDTLTPSRYRDNHLKKEDDNHYSYNLIIHIKFTL